MPLTFHEPPPRGVFSKGGSVRAVLGSPKRRRGSYAYPPKERDAPGWWSGTCSGNDLGTSLPPLRPLRLSLCLTRLQRLILGGRLNGCLNRGSGSLYRSGAGGSTCGAEDSLRRSGGSPHFVRRNQGDADGWRCSGCRHPSVAGGLPREPNRPLRQVGGLPCESNRPPRQAGGWRRRSKDSPRRSDCPLPGSDRPTRGPNGSQTGANRPRRLGGGSQTGANRPLQAGGETQSGANRPLRLGRGT